MLPFEKNDIIQFIQLGLEYCQNCSNLSYGYVVQMFHDILNKIKLKEDQMLINCFYDACSKCFDSTLDIHNDQFQKNINKIRSLIKSDSDNVAWLPFMIFDKAVNNYNKYLFIEQYNNLQREVGVNSKNLLDVLFSLTDSNLIDPIYVSRYVRSTSSQLFTSVNHHMMNIQGQSSTVDCNNGECLNGKMYELVFVDDLSLYKFKNKDSNIINSVTSINDIAKFICDDISKLSSTNSLNNFYIREYLRPCMKLYILKINQIHQEILPDAKLFNMLVNTLDLYHKYQHKASKLFLGIMLIASKCCFNMDTLKYLNIQQDDFMLNQNLDVSDLISNLKSSLDHTTLRCDVGTLVALCNDTFTAIDSECLYRKSYENVISKSAIQYVNNAFAASFNLDTELINLEKSTESCSPFNSSERLNTNALQAITCLNESFEIKKDGTIKIVLKGRMTLMDEYADNHRLLKLNDSNHDIDSMKYNLVYAILIIESADRILHNPKIAKNSIIYKDAEKAKSFANNDIVTYLPKVKMYDPSFNLNEFYQKVRADKYTIEVDGVETISGVKKIAQALMV